MAMSPDAEHYLLEKLTNTEERNRLHKRVNAGLSVTVLIQAVTIAGLAIFATARKATTW